MHKFYHYLSLKNSWEKHFQRLQNKNLQNWDIIFPPSSVKSTWKKKKKTRSFIPKIHQQEYIIDFNRKHERIKRRHSHQWPAIYDFALVPICTNTLHYLYCIQLRRKTNELGIFSFDCYFHPAGTVYILTLAIEGTCV